MLQSLQATTTRAVLLAIPLLGAWPLPAQGQTAYQVKDINTIGDASVGLHPIFTVGIGDRVFFRGTDEPNGSELWTSDGTAAATHLVKDLVPEQYLSPPYGNFTNVNGTLFFTLGEDLWKSDGTAAGTVRMKFVGQAGNFTAVNGMLFFTAGAGSALWKSDGTVPGTTMIPNVFAQRLINVGGTLFFAGSDAAHGLELWRSDGTEGGTVLVRDICPGSCSSLASPQVPPLSRTEVAVGSLAFFAANDGNSGSELWVSDGTMAGTRLVSDLVPGPIGSNPFELEALGSRVVFAAWTSSPDQSLWVSDGTGPGTLSLGSMRPIGMTRVGSSIYFAGNDGSATGSQLWRTDGTPAGTTVVEQLCPGCGISGWEPSGQWGGRLPSGGGLIYFLVGPTGSRSRDLWRSDGTEAGTYSVREFPVPPVLSWSFAGTSTGIYFTASDGVAGDELWKSDGSVAGTRMVRDLVSLSSSPSRINALGDRVIYGALDPTTGLELWSSDGSVDGTHLVKDINLGDGDSIFRDSPRIAYQGALLFDGSDGQRRLWRTDGTEDGTYPLLGEIPRSFGVAGSLAFFSTDSSAPSGAALWKSDGTLGGISIVAPSFHEPKQLTPAGNLIFFEGDSGLSRSDGTPAGTLSLDDEQPRNLTNAHGTLFFQKSGISSDSLWKSDGTLAGTVQVRDGLTLVLDEPMASVGNRVYFSAPATVTQPGLWRSDGTTAGTVLVKSDVSPSLLFNASGVLFFSQPGSGGLWKSDGTAAGTILVKDLPAVSDLIDVDGTLYFAAYDPEHGRELWKSDGTAEGTVLVQDISPGPASSNPQGFARAGGLVYFSADDGTTGAELWAFPVPASAVAAMTSPAPASRLPGATATFTWAPGVSASEYWLTVGTTFGGGQILSASQGRSLSRVVSGLPIDGSTVYVRLWTLFGGSWRSVDYTYLAAVPRPATMVTPVPGAALNSSVVTFNWEAGVGATAYWLFVGTTPAGVQIYPGSQVTNLSASVSGVPTTGAPIYVRLFSLIGGRWQHIDYSYTTGGPAVSLTVSATTVQPGQTVQVTLQGGPGNLRDWVGLHSSTALDASYLDWRYLNGTKTIPATPLTSATLTFTMPTTTGTYNFRFFQNGVFTKLATSPTVTVGTVANPVLNVTPTSLAFGGVPVGATLNKTVVVKNTGGGTLAGTGSVTGTGYSIVGTASYSLTANQEMTLTVRFAPTAGGSASGTLTLTGGAGAAVPLTGNGTSAGPSLTIVGGVTTVAPGATVQVQVTNGPGAAKDWVALHTTAAADNVYLDWKYLNGTRTAPVAGLTSATLTFTMPTAAGAYQFRFFANNTFTRLAVSPSVTVSVIPPTLAVSATSATPGQAVQVTVQNGPGNPTDWVGLLATGAANTASLSWNYLNGTRVAPAVGLTSATLTFTMPPMPGTYEFRLFRNNTNTAIATSPTVSVAAIANPPTLTVSATTTTPGQVVQVTVQNGPGNPADWIALANTGAANTSSLSWYYLNGTRTAPSVGLTTATVTFPMPATPGSYEFRLFQNNTYTRLATSPTVTVQ